MEEKRSARTSKIKRLFAGLLTGIANGLFGAGGGMVAVAALKLICGYDEAEAHACAISIMLPLTVVSAAIYIMRGNVDYGALLYVAPALTAGAFIGALLTGKLNARWLNRIFCALMLFAAVWMLI